MTVKRFAVAALLMAAIGGCHKTPPTQSGGKSVSYWLEAVTGPDAKLRKEAVEKLGNVGPTDPAALPAVIRALRDQDAKVRRAAIVALMKFGPLREETKPILTDLKARDPDVQVRSFAARALDRVASDAEGRD